MTPPGLDAALIEARLQLLRQVLDDLDSVGTVDARRLATDRLLRYAVERMLASVVDLAVSINGHLAAGLLGMGPSTYRESFALAARAGALSGDLAGELAPSVGLRNVLTHEYAAIDLDLVAHAVDLARTGYRRYLGAIARFLASGTA